MVRVRDRVGVERVTAIDSDGFPGEELLGFQASSERSVSRGLRQLSSSDRHHVWGLF